MRICTLSAGDHFTLLCLWFHHAREKANALLEPPSVPRHYLPLNARFLSLNAQERGKPEEAAREVRTLLAILRDEKNQATLQQQPAPCYMLLQQAISKLAILDPEYGDGELSKAVAVQVAKLRSLAR